MCTLFWVGMPAKDVVGADATFLEGMPAKDVVGADATFLEGMPAKDVVGADATFLEGIPAKATETLDLIATLRTGTALRTGAGALRTGAGASMRTGSGTILFSTSIASTKS